MAPLVLSGLVFAFGTVQLLVPASGPRLDPIGKGYEELAAGDDESTARGIQDFRIALRRDPASPYRWCDLGESLLQAGDLAMARYCFRQAVKLAPGVPPILLRSAHFQMTVGADADAMETMSTILIKVPTYDDLIFHYYDRIGSGVREILARGIPPDRRPAQAYFRYRLRQPNAAPDDLRTTWAWLTSRGFGDPALANEYIAALARLVSR